VKGNVVERGTVVAQPYEMTHPQARLDREMIRMNAISPVLITTQPHVALASRSTRVFSH
jgi:hypothetical protein